ncbi:MAG TPA: MSMEG_4193 family putative phosphomutase [Acidimicrobiales bacterium]
MATPKRSTKAAPAPPATLVLLVRHGTTPSTGQVLPGRAPGLHLADAGKEQASKLGERLAAWAPADGVRPRIAAVYASPLERTQETAAPLAAALGLRVRVARGLIECDFGEWTGEALKKLVKLPEWNAVQRYPSGFRFPGGESFSGMQARMVATMADLRSRHQSQTIVAVSHADPIKAVVADALGTHLDLFQRIVISPCSVTAISYGPVGPMVLAVNSTGSLSDLVPS